VTVVGAIAAWFVTRDIYPLDVSRVHAGWIALAAVIGLNGALFIIIAPVWEPWSSTASWFAVVVGIALGLIVSLLTLPAVARATGKTLNDVFSHPMSQWYALGLGLGLLTLTLGGVWIGILLPLAFWSLGLAGVAPMKQIPRSTKIGFGLLAANSALALYATTQLVV
jgi:hypothetical protein